MKKLSRVLAGIILVTSSAHSWSQVNVLENGNFEQFTNSGIPDAWTRRLVTPTGSLSQNSSIFKCGDHSLQIVDLASNASEGANSEAIPVLPGVPHEAGAYVRRTAGENAPSLWIQYYETNAPSAAPIDAGSFFQLSMSSVNEWAYVSVKGRAPINAHYARVLCYSSMNSTGTMYFDGVSFRRAATLTQAGDEGGNELVNWVDNPDMALDEVGATPVNWHPYWSANVAPTVATDDAHPSKGNVMQITDNSTTLAFGSYASSPVMPNMTYKASCEIYFQDGTPPSLYLKYYDRDGNEVASTAAFDYEPGVWTNRSVTLKAPGNAATAKIIAYIGAGGTGTSFFDNIKLTESYETKYVSPGGGGDGSSVANPAKYNDVTFWRGSSGVMSKVNNPNTPSSVKVVFLEGEYPVASVTDAWGWPNQTAASNVLTMEGQRPFGSFFNRTANSALETPVMTLLNMQNVVLRHLHWEDANTSGNYTTASLDIVSSPQYPDTQNILVEGCSFVGLTKNSQAAIRIGYTKTHDITVAHCDFVRVGVNMYTHALYCFQAPRHLRILNNYFQDCTGSCIKFRGGSKQSCDNVLVDQNIFVSTNGTYNWPFIVQSQSNLSDPSSPSYNGNSELFGSNHIYTNNLFSYPQVPAGQTLTNSPFAVGFGTNCFDAMNEAGKIWLYRLTLENAQTLTSGTLGEKKALVKEHFNLDFEVLKMSNNTRLGSHLYNVGLATFTDAAPDYHAKNLGGNGKYDISDLITDLPPQP